jgi:hypothetical protein
MKPKESEELIQKKKSLMVLSSRLLHVPAFMNIFMPMNMKSKIGSKS